MYYNACGFILGPEFGLHCVNHLVLPMIQGWLRKSAQLSTFCDGSVANFRQCCGLCTDLVVEYVIQFASKCRVFICIILLLCGPLNSYLYMHWIVYFKYILLFLKTVRVI